MITILSTADLREIAEFIYGNRPQGANDPFERGLHEGYEGAALVLEAIADNLEHGLPLKTSMVYA